MNPLTGYNVQPNSIDKRTQLSSTHASSPHQLLTISEAAKLLKVSVKTLRRWETEGLLKPQRNDQNYRVYSADSLLKIPHKKYEILPHSIHNSSHFYTISQAAQKLQVSTKTIRRWEKAGKLSCERNENGQRIFSQHAIHQLKKQMNALPSLFFRPSLKNWWYSAPLATILFFLPLQFIQLSSPSFLEDSSFTSTLQRYELFNNSSLSNVKNITNSIANIDPIPSNTNMNEEYIYNNSSNNSTINTIPSTVSNPQLFPDSLPVTGKLQPLQLAPPLP